MTEHEPDPGVKAFLASIERLDAGDRAKLKRDAGKTIAESKSIGLFYRLLPHDLSVEQEESYFLVATLFPLAESGGLGNLGASLYRARDPNQKQNKGLDRRIEILLDADKTQLPFRLRQTILFLKSKRVRVNWQRLLEDLQKWDHPNRIIQKQWAYSYFKLTVNRTDANFAVSVEPK